MIHQIISHLKKDMESLYTILSNIVVLTINNYREIFLQKIITYQAHRILNNYRVYINWSRQISNNNPHPLDD